MTLTFGWLPEDVEYGNDKVEVNKKKENKE